MQQSPAQIIEWQSPLNDSITTIPSYQDTPRINNLIELAKEYRHSNIDSAETIYKEVWLYSQALNYGYGMGMTLTGMGSIYLHRGYFEKSEQLLQAALPYFYDNPQQLIVTYNNLSNTYRSMGNYSDAAMSLYKAMQLLPHAANSALDALFIYGGLFDIWREIDPENPLPATYLREAVMLAQRKSHDPDVLYKTHQNMGNMYRAGQKMDSAIYEYKMALAYARMRSNKLVNQINMLNELADVHSLSGAPQEAIPYLQEAISIGSKKYSKSPVIITSQYQLGNAYYLMGQYDKALLILEQALQQAYDVGFRAQPTATIHGRIADMYIRKGVYQKALIHQWSYFTMRDSLLGRKNIQVLGRMETRQKIAEKDKEIAQKQLMLAQQDKKLAEKNGLIISGAAIILIAVLLIFFLRKNNKNKEARMQQEAEVQHLKIQTLQQEMEMQKLLAAMQGVEKERARVASELHDGIISQLSAIKMRLDTIGISDIGTNKDGYNETIHYLNETITDLRRTAHNMMPDVLMQLGLHGAILDFCKKINDTGGLQIEVQQYGVLPKLSQDFELSLYRIVQELIHNIVKHAEASNGIVQIGYHDGILNLTVEDDGKGVGRNKTQYNDHGMGLNNLRSRVEALCGSMDVVSREAIGTAIYLEFDVIRSKKENSRSSTI